MTEHLTTSLYPPDQPLSEAEVSKLLGCSVKTLRRREIRHSKVGRKPVYLWRWIVDYLEKSAA
jgi:hypothetical protein